MLQRHPAGCELKWFDVAEVIGDLDESSFRVVMGVEARSQCVELEKAGKAMGLKDPYVSQSLMVIEREKARARQG